MRKRIWIGFALMLVFLSGCGKNVEERNRDGIEISVVESGGECTKEYEAVPEETVKVETDDQKRKPVRLQLSDYEIPDLEKNTWTIEELYRKEDGFSDTYYIIDSEGQLWATGFNDFGQLGIGTESDSYDIRIESEFHKVFDHVQHVSYSGEYFAAFVTIDHKLYGMGANLDGVMCMQPKEPDKDNPWNTVASSPRLLMTDVKYAVCAYRMILALKSDNSVWILGRPGDRGVPVKIMDQAELIVAGTENFGIITKEGDLWIWGTNDYGQCGVELGGYLNEPVKAASNVAMCWFPKFSNQTLIKKRDGSMEICGYGVGEKTMDINVPGQYGETQTVMYSDEFLPVVME